jgi:SAM-dependent methyltransferase
VVDHRGASLAASQGLGEADAAATYGADLARIHHEHFGDLAEAAAGELLRRLAARGIHGGTVVELGCGSGRSCRVLLEAGFEVVGVDRSEEMLRLARAHAPGARYQRGSLRDAPLPRCVAVTAVGEALNYAAPGDLPDAARLARRLGEVAAALQQGGLLLLDVAGPGRAGPGRRRQGSWHRPGAAVLLDEVEAADGATLARTILTFAAAGALYRRGFTSTQTGG